MSTFEDGESAILRLLEYVSNLEVKTVPNCYVKLIDEISKNTPIARLITLIVITGRIMFLALPHTIATNTHT